MKKKKFKLELYEVKCSRCHGKGYIKKSKHWKGQCDKCFGTGKLDWIDNIFGKRPVSFSDIMAGVVDEMAKQLAEDIDREIMNELYSQTINLTIKKKEIK